MPAVLITTDYLRPSDEVDAYVTLWNPQGRQSGPVIWSPDIDTPRIIS